MRPLLGIFGFESEKKLDLLIIVSTKRSGSTLVCDVLHQCKNTYSGYEILNRSVHPGARFIYSPECLGHYLRSSGRGNYAEKFAVKIFHEHLRQLNLSWKDVYDHFSDAVFVHLWRSDTLAQYASLVQAERDGIWLAKNNEDLNNKKSIIVESSNFREYKECTVKNDHDAYKTLSEHANYQLLCYEDLVGDPLKGINQEILVPWKVTIQSPVEIWTKKPNAALEDRIANWNKLSSEITSESRYHPGFD